MSINVKEIKRGQIYWCNLGVTNGSIQGNVRPVLIVSNDMANKFSPVITIVPLTTSQTKKKMPTHVDIYDKGTALVEQMTIINKSSIGDYICEIDEVIMKKVNKSIAIQTGLLDAQSGVVNL